MDLLATALVRDECDGLAVRGVLYVEVAGGAVGELAELTLVGRGREELTVDTEDDPFAVGAEVIIVDGRVELLELREGLLRFGGDIERDRLDLPAGEVELPDPEFVLEDDRFAVAARDRGNGRRLPVKWVICSAWPPVSPTRQILVCPLPSRSLTK